MANIKSQIKRIRTNEKARLRNKAVKSALKTAIRKFREAADAGNVTEAVALMRAACRQLDKAVSKGVIHRNQAANRKSAIARRAAALQQAAPVATEEKPTRRRGTATRPAKAAKAATRPATRTTRSTSRRTAASSEGTAATTDTPATD